FELRMRSDHSRPRKRPGTLRDVEVELVGPVGRHLADQLGSLVVIGRDPLLARLGTGVGGVWGRVPGAGPAVPGVDADPVLARSQSLFDRDAVLAVDDLRPVPCPLAVHRGELDDPVVQRSAAEGDVAGNLVAVLRFGAAGEGAYDEGGRGGLDVETEPVQGSARTGDGWRDREH